MNRLATLALVLKQPCTGKRGGYVLKKGDIVDLELDNLAHGGDCVGRYNGLAFFVPGGVPGEKVLVRVVEKKKNYARGKIIKIIEKAKERISPTCSVYKECGGCQLQHINYDKQLEDKQRVVESLLHRIGGIDNIVVNPVIGAEFPWNYRNKAQFPLTVDDKGKINTGFFKKGTHEVVIQNNCNIQHPLINRIAKKTLNILNKYEISVYNEIEHRGLLRHLVIRAGVCTNQALITIVTSQNIFPHKYEIAKQLINEVPELVGVFQNINSEKTNVILGKEMELLAGQQYYIDYIGNIKFAISPQSFFQVNTLQADKLYNKVLQYSGLTGKEIVFDGYCGIGSIALYMANKAKKVYGIEEVEEAIKDAKNNARLNNIKNCEFQTGKVEDKLPELIKKGIRPDLVIFDPPRKGLSDSVINTVKKARPERIIYVSCNPATLARDLAKFKENYSILKVQPVDMFPQTYHIETVVLMQVK